jgi:putative hemolysin
MFGFRRNECMYMMSAQDAALSGLTGEEDPLLDTAGALEARLATTAAEIEAAQRLRYEVFYLEMNARPTADMKAQGRDFDQYDPYCQHMLVVDRAHGNRIIGTYRLTSGEAAARSPHGFYTAGEYDIAAMLRQRQGQKLLELGRSCVLKDYRTGPTMQLLWRGIFVYLLRHKVDLMFGCASLPGTDPEKLALQLSFLYHFHLAPPGEIVNALPSRAVGMNMMPKEAIDEAAALHALPPLVKGYIRSGARVGNGAVIDHQFGTTDVFIYFPISNLNPRWAAHLRRKSSTDKSGQAIDAP